MDATYQERLHHRLTEPPAGWLDAKSTLRHFALITYAIPEERLEKIIPLERFKIPLFEIGGEKKALLSVVPFWDQDFHFLRILPFLRFSFGQTNHRVYVVDKTSGEDVVWFLGTTLGSVSVLAPRLFWKLPWRFARYKVDCDYDQEKNRYRHFRYWIRSRWCSATIDLQDTGEPVGLLEGFHTIDEMMLVLTHPVEGYFRGPDHRLGTYGIRHPLMKLTVGRANQAYFSLYERLEIMTKAEMENPHSVLITPSIDFRILLPPKPAGNP